VGHERPGRRVNAFRELQGELEAGGGRARERMAGKVNVMGGVMPLQARDAIPVLRQWLADGEAAQIQLLFETHRDSTLNDLYYTLEILEALPELRLCADLSHFVVDREFRAPISQRDQAWIDTILQRSDCFQGRVANREQIQIQLEFPQHQEGVEIFKG